MKISTQKGFTLIELLVVISIIGLLSSVVLASVSTAREKGKVAAGRTFDGHTYQAFAASSVVIFDFDDGQAIGATAIPRDKSGNGQTFSGCSSLITQGIKGTAITIGPSVACSNASFPFVGFNPSKGSMSFWFKPDAIGNYPNFMFFKAAGSWNPFNNGIVTLLGIAANKPIAAGVWSHFLISWDDSAVNKTVIYINGAVDKSITTLPGFVSGDNNLFIGSTFGGGPSGAVDQFAVYSQSIQTAQEAAEIYAAELPTHTLADAN